MDSVQLILNDQLVTITADLHTVKRLNEDDQYLAEYVNRAAKAGQFHFLFTKDPSLRRIVVKRVPTTFVPVWCRKGRPSEDDLAASVFLLKLRNSSKYVPRFKDGYSLKSKLWEEIANEMRVVGFDVDGPKCAQKFVQLAQSYQKKDFFCYDSAEMYDELRKIFGERRESEEEDEEWLPKGGRKRRRSGEEDDGEFLKKFLRKSSELKEERFKEMCSLINRRNELLEEKLKQNREIITILGKFLK